MGVLARQVAPDLVSASSIFKRVVLACSRKERTTWAFSAFCRVSTIADVYLDVMETLIRIESTIKFSRLCQQNGVLKVLLIKCEGRFPLIIDKLLSFSDIIRIFGF